MRATVSSPDEAAEPPNPGLVFFLAVGGVVSWSACFGKWSQLCSFFFHLREEREGLYGAVHCNTQTPLAVAVAGT